MGILQEAKKMDKEYFAMFKNDGKCPAGLCNGGFGCNHTGNSEEFEKGYELGYQVGYDEGFESGVDWAR